MIEDFYNRNIAFLKKVSTSGPLNQMTWVVDIFTVGLVDHMNGRNIVRDEVNKVVADTFLGCPFVDVDPRKLDSYLIKDLDLHTITSDDIGDELTYWHSNNFTTWIQTTNANLGENVLFYKAIDALGTQTRTDGKRYEIYSVHNPNKLNHHLEIKMLNKDGF